MTIMEQDGVTSDSGATTSVARGSLFYLTGTLAGALANFVMLALIQRQYGTGAFGVFSAVTALFLVLATVTRLGGDTGATWYVSRLLARGQRHQVAGAVRAALTPVVLASVLVSVVVIVAAHPIADMLSKSSSQANFATMLRVVAVGLPLATVADVLLGATRGYGTMRPTVLASQLGRQVGQLLAVALAVLLSTDLRLLALAWTAPYAVAAVYPALWLRGRAALGAESVEAEVAAAAGSGGRAHWRDFWRYSGPQAANSSAQIGLEKFDILALGPLVGEVAAGQYSAANRLAHLAVLGLFAVNAAHVPMWARLFEVGDTRAINRTARTASTWSILLIAPLLWSFVVFGSVWLGIIGAGLSGGATALAVLAATILLLQLVGPAESLLLMSGDSGRAFLNNLIALLINVALNLLLIPMFDVVGAALAWGVALLTVRGLAARQVWQARRVRVLGLRVTYVWLVVSAICAASSIATRLALGESRAGLALAFVFCGAVLAPVAWARRKMFGLDELLEQLAARPASVAARRYRSAVRSPSEPPAVRSPSEPPAVRSPSEPPAVPSIVGPHLEFSLRSRAVVRRPLTRERVRLLVDVMPFGGWRGRLLCRAIGAAGAVAPNRLNALPWFTVHDNAPLTLPPQIVRRILATAVCRLRDPEVDGAIWLLPPGDDERRLGCLLLSEDVPVAHLRARLRGSPGLGPRPMIDRGARTGVRFPVVLDQWFVDEIFCELTTIVATGRHEPAGIDDATLHLLVADIAESLAGCPVPTGTPPGAVPMHGDLTPWNLRRDAAGALLLFDWEHATWGPPDADLIRYYSTVDGGVERFARLSRERRGQALDAVLHWRRVAQIRYAQPAVEDWKRADRRREVGRLSALGRLASPDEVPVRAR